MVGILVPGCRGGHAVNIRPSSAIRQNDNEIADLCRKSAAFLLVLRGCPQLTLMCIGLTKEP